MRASSYFYLNSGRRTERDQRNRKSNYFVKIQIEEQKQAKVYEEFVREFEHDAPKVKTFVKGDVINSESSKIIK